MRSGSPQGVETTVVVLIGLMFALIALRFATVDAAGELSVRGNSALLLGGSAGVILSVFVIFMDRTRGGNGRTLFLAIVLGLAGATTLLLVDVESVRTRGVIVGAPFVVPILIGLIRLLRR